MYKYIFIDSNCTLEDDKSFLSSNRTYFKKIADILNCQEYVISEFLDKFNKLFGSFVWEYHEIFWRALSNNLGFNNNQQIIDRLYATFLDFYDENICLYEDTIDALEVLSKKCKLVLVANGNAKRLERLISKFNLRKYFCDFVISSETPFKKPEKFMFQYMCRIKNISSAEVIMVGDRIDNDILGAKRCGLSTVLLDRTSKHLNLGNCSDYVAPNLSSIIEIVDLSGQYPNDLIKSRFLLETSTPAYNKSLTAFIAAGGKGSRLGTLGIQTQKCMLTIWNNKPILAYVLDILRSVGCQKIKMAVSHLKEQIIDYFGDGSNFGVQIEYVSGDFKSTYDAIYSTLPKLSDTFIYIHGDILFAPEVLSSLLSLNSQSNESCAAVINNKNVHLTHAQMAISHRNITNIDLTERDEHFPYTFLGTGVYKKSDFIDFFDGDTTGMVEKFIHQKLQKCKTTKAIIYKGEWRHFETEADVLKAKNESEWIILTKGKRK